MLLLGELRPVSPLRRLRKLLVVHIPNSIRAGRSAVLVQEAEDLEAVRSAQRSLS